jgi:CheY-like chemotaxis protein
MPPSCLQQANVETPPRSFSAGSPTVLVADDDPESCREICGYLTSIGYTVLAASDGVTALGMIYENRPDVALLGINAPGCDIARLTEIGMLLHDRLAIILLSTDDASGRAMMSRGALTVVNKPVSLHELRDLLIAVTSASYR